MTDEPTWPSPPDPTDSADADPVTDEPASAATPPPAVPDAAVDATPPPPAPAASAHTTPPPPPAAPADATTPPPTPVPPPPTPVPPPPPGGVAPPAAPGAQWPGRGEEPPTPTTDSRRRLIVPLLALTVVAAGATLVAGGTDPEERFDGRARAVDTAALEAAGCVEVSPGSDLDRSHVEPSEAPPASELYDVPLPAQGPHFGAWSPVLTGVPAQPIDPRAVLHNLEHGAAVVWVDPDVIGEATLGEVAVWRDQLGAAGFDYGDTGAAVFTSRMPDDVTLDAGVALRAWGVAVDCPGWDVDAVDAFVAQHYGTRGEAPESGLGPYPQDNGVLLGPPDENDSGTSTV